MKVKDLISYSLSGISIILAIYFYLESIENRELVYSYDSSPTQILDSEDIKTAPIKVFRDDGTEITSDLYVESLRFWNNGKKSIKKENILQPLILNCYDTSTEILDVRIIKTSRDICDLSLKPRNNTNDSFIIDFHILEKGDGGTIQVIYEGKRTNDYTIKGIIEGAKTIKNKKDEIFNPNTISGGPILLLTLIFIFIGSMALNQITKIKDADKISEKFGRTVVTAILVVFLLVILFSVLSSFMVNANLPEWLSI